MQEKWEFRINEEFSHLLFGPEEGVRLGDSIRKVTIPRSDMRFDRIKEIQAKVKRRSKRAFFFGWSRMFEYSKAEIAAAELFHLNIWSSFEPAGIECGTQYTIEDACEECGIARIRRQITPLILDLRKAPKTKDISCTNSNLEWIVTQRLAELLVDAKLTGFDLQRVKHKARYEDDSVDLRAVPSGQELIRRAKVIGIEYMTTIENTIAFDNWLGRPEQNELLQRAFAENAERKRERARKRGTSPPVWYQLIITSQPVSMVLPTRCGTDPFDDDPDGAYRCPYGHIMGLNLLSEISVARGEWDGSDLAHTLQYTGYPFPKSQRNFLLPGGCSGNQHLLISPRFREVLLEHKIKGWSSDVAYLR